jgi:hypothetical protein
MYLFTAAQTELGKSEEWFWNVTPRKLIAMLDEKKKMELIKIKTLAYLINGGTLEDDDEDESVVYYDPLM